MRTRSWLRFTGLRPRMVAGFVFVAVVGAAAAAGAGFTSSRAALVAEVQDGAAEDLRRRVAEVAVTVDYPPDQQALDRMRVALGTSTMVVYGELVSAAGPNLETVTRELRDAVGAGQEMVLQRVSAVDGPRLVLGTPVLETLMDGARRDSGIEVYAVRDLSATETRIADSARAAVLTTVLALPLALLIALVVAGRVLRPVRELRAAADRMAGGDLAVRPPVRGSDELGDLARAFVRMAERLQGTVAELRGMEADARRFVADVSHELRTPLTTLVAVAEVLEADADLLPADARTSVLLAAEEIRGLAGLVEDLVEISRFDAGRASLLLDDVDVPRTVHACLSSRGWSGEVQLVAPESLRARLDPRRLDVIVANLVGNALRHGRPPVRVSLRADGGEVELEVVDHGPGLSEEVRTRVFERFYKADAARTRSEGSGLGLSIALANARLHGGVIEAGDAPGAGARFVLRLPGAAR
ncbi:ATP-binding protein [Actinokineospora sp. NPDC004072]